MTECSKYGQFYIVREYDEGEFYYDLYWYIKRDVKSEHIENITRRVSKESAIRVIKEVENKELPFMVNRILDGDRQK